MIVFAIIVALATLSWLGSLAYAYFTNQIERSRLNKDDDCSAGRGVVGGVAYRH
jgi:hypothetical protein